MEEIWKDGWEKIIVVIEIQKWELWWSKVIIIYYIRERRSSSLLKDAEVRIVVIEHDRILL